MDSLSILLQHDKNNAKYRKMIDSIVIPSIAPPEKLNEIEERMKYPSVILSPNPAFNPTIMTQYIGYKGKIDPRAFFYLPVNYDEDNKIPEGERGIFISASLESKSRGVERKAGSKSFKNSCMLRLIGEKVKSDVKLFSGVIHVCGCKNSEESQETFLIIIENLVKIQKIFDVVNLDKEIAHKVVAMIVDKVRGEVLKEIEEENEFEKVDYEDVLYTVASSNLAKTMIEEKTRDITKSEPEEDYSLNKLTFEEVEEDLKLILNDKYGHLPSVHSKSHFYLWKIVCTYILGYIKETAVLSEFKDFLDCFLDTKRLFSEDFGDYTRDVPMVNHNFTPERSICRKKLVREMKNFPQFTVSFISLIDSHVTIRISMKYIRDDVKSIEEMTEAEIQELESFYGKNMSKNCTCYKPCVIRTAPKPRATLLVNATILTMSNPDADASEHTYRMFYKLLNRLGDRILL